MRLFAPFFRESRRVAPRFFIALVLISVTLIAIAGTLIPSKVRGSLPGPIETRFNILRSHTRVQDSKHSSRSLSFADAASSIGISPLSRKFETSSGDLQISQIQDSWNSGSHGGAELQSSLSIVQEEGDGDKKAGDQRDLVVDSETSSTSHEIRPHADEATTQSHEAGDNEAGVKQESAIEKPTLTITSSDTLTKLEPSEQTEPEGSSLSKGEPLTSDLEPSRSKAEMTHQKKRYDSTISKHRHLEPHNLTGTFATPSHTVTINNIPTIQNIHKLHT